MSAVLELQDVHAAYGRSRVLFAISLELHAGECACLLGRGRMAERVSTCASRATGCEDGDGRVVR